MATCYRGSDFRTDIWLWKDGDEEWAAELTEPWLPPTDSWHKALSALKTRLHYSSSSADVASQRLSPFISQRIHNLPDPNVRFAAIAWLFITSDYMKVSDAKRGLNDRTHFDLGQLVADWWQSIEGRLSLPDYGDEITGILDKLTGEGHTCHLDGSRPPKHICVWIGFMLWLYDGTFPDSVCFDRTGCDADMSGVAAPMEALSTHPGSGMSATQDRSNTKHPRIWHALTWVAMPYSDDPDGVQQWFKAMESVHTRVASMCDVELWKTLKLEMLRRLVVDEADPKYAPWINTYPDSWRAILTDLSSDDWKCAEDAWQKAILRAGSAPTRSLDLLTLIGIIFWIIAELSVPDQSDDDVIAHGDIFQSWYNILATPEIVPLIEALSPVPTNSVVLEFHDAVAASGHTCYSTYGAEELNWYAVVISTLEACEEVPIRGLDTSSFAECEQCRNNHAVVEDDVPDSAIDSGSFLGFFPVPSLSSLLSPTQLASLQASEHIEQRFESSLMSQMPDDSSGQEFELPLWVGEAKVYRNLLSSLVQNVFQHSPAEHDHDWLGKWEEPVRATFVGNEVLRLAKSQLLRSHLLQALPEMQSLAEVSIGDGLREDETEVFKQLHEVLTSNYAEKELLLLKGDDANAFVTLLQWALDNMESLWASAWPGQMESMLLHRPQQQQQNKASFRRTMRRALVKLSEVSEALPSSLFVTGIKLTSQNAIAGGGFADIFQGTMGQVSVAIKRLRLFQSMDARLKLLKEYRKEALIWRQLSHPNALPFLGIDAETFDAPYLCLIAPWLNLGSAASYILKDHSSIVDIDRLLEETASGLEYLHNEGLVHGDLRGGNILIDDEYHARLADFGLAGFADMTRVASNSTSRHGSTRWMAPELHAPEMFGFNEFRRTRASDVYAFGCVCLELYTGRPPFSELSSDVAVAIRVIQGAWPSRPDLDTCRGRLLLDSLWALINQCWETDAQKRPSIDQAVRTLSKMREHARRQSSNDLTAQLAQEAAGDLQSGQVAAFYESTENEALYPKSGNTTGEIDDVGLMDLSSPTSERQKRSLDFHAQDSSSKRTKLS